MRNSRDERRTDDNKMDTTLKDQTKGEHVESESVAGVIEKADEEDRSPVRWRHE